MNQPIVRLFGLVVVMFALLLAFTSRWTVFEASSLRDNPLNARALLDQQRIERGRIVASDGTVLAHSVRTSSSGPGEGTFVRTYPTGDEFAHAIGYAFIDLGRTGLERFRNGPLNGRTNNDLQSILDQLQGKRRRGDEVVTTLDPAGQQIANSQLAGHEGAVVALDPRTGAVRVMASSPSFDPNSLRSRRTYARLAKGRGGRPLVNRATQVSGKDNVPISGVPLQNDNNESFGHITLTEGLVKSVNTVWAQVAERLGKRTMARYMSRFGFDRKPRLDYPSDEMSTSGEYRGTHLVHPTSSLVDVGRMGIGQDKLEVTPLQMAQVAAAVANHGRLMTPHLTARIVDTDGRTVQTIKPHLQAVVMKPSTAAALTSMMEAVVNEGTGTAAQIPGVRVAGKTGTAETQIGAAINNVWFIAFAPADEPRVAVAVTLRGVPGQGAAFAAPVARRVMEGLLHG